MIPDVELLKYSRDLSGRDSEDVESILLHYRYLQKNGVLHPSASTLIKVYFHRMEILCGRLIPRSPEFACGNPPILYINADNSLSFLVDDYVKSTIGVFNSTITVSINDAPYSISTTDGYTYRINGFSVVGYTNSSLTVVITFVLDGVVCRFSNRDDGSNNGGGNGGDDNRVTPIRNNTGTCHELDVVIPIIVNIPTLVKFSLPDEVSSQLVGFNTTYSVVIGNISHPVSSNGTFYSVSIQDIGIYNNLYNLPIRLRIVSGDTVCLFYLGLYKPCIIDEIVTQLPAGYTVVKNPLDTTIFIEIVTDVIPRDGNVTVSGTTGLPSITTIIDVYYKTYTCVVTLNDCYLIRSIDDLNFSITSERVEAIDYGIGTAEHIHYHDMVDPSHTMPVTSVISEAQFVALTAGIIPTYPMRSIYIVAKGNGLETYTVRMDGSIRRISDDIYSNQIEYTKLVLGETYQAPIIGIFNLEVYYNLFEGEVVFTLRNPEIPDFSYHLPPDLTILNDFDYMTIQAVNNKDDFWYRAVFKSKSVIERFEF